MISFMTTMNILFLKGASLTPLVWLLPPLTHPWVSSDPSDRLHSILPCPPPYLNNIKGRARQRREGGREGGQQKIFFTFIFLVELGT